MRVMFTVALATLVTVGAAVSQDPGDYIVATTDGLLAVKPGTGTVTTLTTMDAGVVMMSADNRSIEFAPENDATYRRYRPGAGVELVTDFPGGGYLADLTLEGTSGFLATRRSANQLLAFRGGRQYLLFDLLAPLSIDNLGSVRTDLETGDWFIPVWRQVPATATRLLRIDRATMSVTTVFEATPDYHVVDEDPRTGHLVAARWYPTPAIDVLDRSGQVVRSWATPSFVQDIAIDPVRSQFHCLVRNTSGQPEILAYAADGTLLEQTSVAIPVIETEGLTIYGSRPLSSEATAVVGKPHALECAFHNAAGLPYFILLGQSGPRPGVALPDGRRVHIADDAYFRQTLLGGDIPNVTTGLRGTLDANGRATAWITVPPATAVGTRILATAIVLDPAESLGVRVSNPWGFSVAPDTAGAARFRTFGLSGPGSMGGAKLSPVGPGPVIGTTFTVRVTQLPTSPANLAFMIVSPTVLTPEADLGPIGMRGSRLYIAPTAVIPVQNAGGNATWSVAIPNDRNLVGTEFFTQAFVLDPGLNALGVGVSDAGEAVIGR